MASRRHPTRRHILPTGAVFDAEFRCTFDLLATIPHARYTDVAGTGHMVAGDDNSVFLERVAEFLDREVRLRGRFRLA